MKGDIYKYEGKEYALQGEFFDEYVKKTGIELKKVYSMEEATNIINSNVISVYKGISHCKQPFTGEEICDLLSEIHEEFNIRVDVVCGEE